MREKTDCDFDSFVAFDIEHTGTFGIDNGDAEAEIIEIGAVKVVDGNIVDRFDMLANPGRTIVPRIARLTHITDDMLSEPLKNSSAKVFCWVTISKVVTFPTLFALQNEREWLLKMNFSILKRWQ